MEKLAQYQPLLIIIFSVALIAMLIVVMVWNKKLVNHMIKNKVTFIDLYEVDVETGEKALSIILTNQSMNDASLTGLGFVYKNKSFDFKEVYLKQFDITGDQIVLAPRASSKLVLTVPAVENPIFSNIDGKRLKKIKIFATSNVGAIFIGKAPRISKILSKDYKALVKKNEKFAKEKRLKEKQENRQNFVNDVASRKSNGEKVGFGKNLKVFFYKLFYKIKAQENSVAPKSEVVESKVEEKQNTENN